MWSRKFDKCINCGTTEIKHVAKGLCRKCYTLNTEAAHKKHIRHKRGVADDFLTKEKLFELYVEKGMSLTDIGKMAGCTRVNVYYKLKKYGIQSRSKTEARTIALDKGKIKFVSVKENGNIEENVLSKIRYDKEFFKNWSDEMAYVLGLIYTDGNLSIVTSESGYELGCLSFGQKDKELVEKILKLMNCDAKIGFRKRRELKNTTVGELHYFRIGNNELINDLIKLGLITKKSLYMKFPDIPKQYLRHFIRGLFDGDGSVYLDGKYIRIKLLSGSYEFINTLNEYLHKIGFPLMKIDYSHTQNKPGAYFIRYNKVNVARRFFDYLYQDVPEKIFYSRKYKIFVDFFSFYN